MIAAGGPFTGATESALMAMSFQFCVRQFNRAGDEAPGVIRHDRLHRHGSGHLVGGVCGVLGETGEGRVVRVGGGQAQPGRSVLALGIDCISRGVCRPDWCSLHDAVTRRP